MRQSELCFSLIEVLMGVESIGLWGFLSVCGQRLTEMCITATTTGELTQTAKCSYLALGTLSRLQCLFVCLQSQDVKRLFTIISVHVSCLLYTSDAADDC